MPSVELAGSLADPEHMGREAVVLVLDVAGEALLVGEDKPFVGDVEGGNFTIYVLVG